MLYLRTFFNFIIPVFNPMEKFFLKVLGDNLTPEGRIKLNQQVAKINLVQRDSNGRVSRLYWIKNGKSYSQDDLRFAAEDLELKLCEITFKISEYNKTITVVIWLVQGDIASMEFNKDMKKFRKCEDFEILSVNILKDPMQVSRSGERTLQEKTGEITGWLGERLKKYTTTNAMEPLTSMDIQKYRKKIEAWLPDDYLELINQVEGIMIEHCSVLGISEVYDVPLNDGNYYILADRGGTGVLTVKYPSNKPELYYFDYEKNKPIAKGCSFFEAIDSIIKSKT